MYRQLLSICGLNPWLDANSMPRIQMFATHLGQKLVMHGMTERYWQTGVEQELAKSSFNVTMPADGVILKVIDRYRQTFDQDSINENPETLVFYQDVVTREIGVITLPKYCAYHPYFGFLYKEQPGLNQIREKAWIKKGEVFLDSPGVTPHGNYMYGRELNMVFMSHPATSEDGIVVSRDVLPHLKFNTFETRTVEWGKKSFMLNTYGSKGNYKGMPGIGDRIRPDGLLVAFRPYDERLAIVDQSEEALMYVDTVFDERVYANGGGGIVRDIKVITNTDLSIGLAPTDKGLEKYIRETHRFYKEIRQFYQSLMRENKGEVSITPEFNNLIQRALVSEEDENNVKNNKMYKHNPIDEFRVEFVIEYEITPTIGFKMTDCYGGKGVICHIEEPENMPVDADGNRADIIMDSYSTINRTNLGRLYEQYFNSASRDVGKGVRKILGIEQGDKKTAVKLVEILENNRAKFFEAWDYLVGYYRIVSPKMAQWYYTDAAELTDEERVEHLTNVVKEHVTIYGPMESSPEYVEMVKNVERFYPPTRSQLTYVGFGGKKVLTKNKIRIGSIYMMLLEKTGDDWSAVDSAKIQHHGVPAKLTRADKHSEAWKPQPGKVAGETEMRLFVANAGPKAVAELYDRNNNPRTHRIAVEGILNADHPTNIIKLIDRDKHPYGGGKPLQQFNHITKCGGWTLEYQSLKNLPRSVTSVKMERVEEGVL